MPTSGFAFLFIYPLNFNCPLCGQSLDPTGIEKPNDTDILVQGKCRRCDKSMTVHTTFQRTLEQLLAKLRGDNPA